MTRRTRVALSPDSHPIRYYWRNASERNLNLLAQWMAGVSLVDIGREFGVSPMRVEQIAEHFKAPRFRRVDVKPKSVRISDEDFWSWADQSGGKRACWPWMGRLDTHGYGKHRRAWLLANPGKTIPKGWHVMHKCDNPPCVNPRHLKPGTRMANIRDAIRKGRMGVRKAA